MGPHSGSLRIAKQLCLCPLRHCWIVGQQYTCRSALLSPNPCLLVQMGQLISLQLGSLLMIKKLCLCLLGPGCLLLNARLSTLAMDAGPASTSLMTFRQGSIAAQRCVLPGFAAITPSYRPVASLYTCSAPAIHPSHSCCIAHLHFKYPRYQLSCIMHALQNCEVSV